MTDDIDLDSFQRPGEFPGDPNGDYPTLHDWKPLRSGSAIRLSGSVRNHPDLPDGEVVTSPLRDIACDRSWCRTFNTLYLLGEQSAPKVAVDEPRPALPLLLRLLLADDWVRAAKIACDGTIAHWLLLDGQTNSDFTEIRFNADAMSVTEGQRRAAAVHAGIADGEMPHAVVDAWQALAAETASPDTCRPTAMAGSAAYDRWFARVADDETARILRRRLAGWRELADDDRRPLNGAEPDQFRLAKALGEEDPEGEEAPADLEGGRIDMRPGRGSLAAVHPEMLAWFAASMPTRRLAADLVVRISRKTLVSGEGAEVIEAFGRRNGFEEPVSTSMAAEVRKSLQELAIKKRSEGTVAVLGGLAGAWSVLAADLTWRRSTVSEAARAIAEAAETHARTLIPGEQAESFRNKSAALLSAWAVLAAAAGPVAGESKDDAVMAAHFHQRRLTKAIGGIDRDVGEPGPDSTAGGVIVLAATGGTSQTLTGRGAATEFESIAGRPVPLAQVPDLAKVRARLAVEFPHALSAIDLLLSDLAGPHIHFKPSLILGNPGGGKTRLIRRLGETLGVYVARFDGSGSSDNAFGGTPRRWSSGEPCFPLNAIRAAGIGNPICHVDEIDKSGTSRHNGSLTQALLPMCEPENSKRFADPYVQSDVNLSFVSLLLTANDDTVLPAPLRDRLRIIRIPHPTIADLPAIARGLVAEIMIESGATGFSVPLGNGAEGFAVPLDGDELEIAAKLWKGGSIRRLRAIIERLLARRDQQAPRH